MALIANGWFPSSLSKTRWPCRFRFIMWRGKLFSQWKRLLREYGILDLEVVTEPFWYAHGDKNHPLKWCTFPLQQCFCRTQRTFLLLSVFRGGFELSYSSSYLPLYSAAEFCFSTWSNFCVKVRTLKSFDSEVKALPSPFGRCNRVWLWFSRLESTFAPRRMTMGSSKLKYTIAVSFKGLKPTGRGR